jgi:hypothetical protein
MAEISRFFGIIKLARRGLTRADVEGRKVH